MLYIHDMHFPSLTFYSDLSLVCICIRQTTVKCQSISICLFLLLSLHCIFSSYIVSKMREAIFYHSSWQCREEETLCVLQTQDKNFAMIERTRPDILEKHHGCIPCRSVRRGFRACMDMTLHTLSVGPSWNTVPIKLGPIWVKCWLLTKYVLGKVPVIPRHFVASISQFTLSSPCYGFHDVFVH